jgi:hypothetical protein
MGHADERSSQVLILETDGLEHRPCRRAVWTIE